MHKSLLDKRYPKYNKRGGHQVGIDQSASPENSNKCTALVHGESQTVSLQSSYNKIHPKKKIYIKQNICQLRQLIFAS